MSRCLWIFGAYSYRLGRRHSTILLIAAFIVTVTVILQLYAYRHNGNTKNQLRIGDFDYRPGAFLTGQLPNENITYCDFQYGLPDTLDWSSFSVSQSPELGAKGPYRVIYNAVRGLAYTNESKFNSVTYVTQATPEFLYHIIEIARFWDGPISLAVYVPNYDLDITMQIVTHMCRCYEAMSKVSLHLFFPKGHPPVIRTRQQKEYTTARPVTISPNISAEDVLRQKLESYRSLDNKTRAEYIIKVRQDKAKRMMSRLTDDRLHVQNLVFPDCSGLENFDFPTYRKEHNMIYPINVGRNIARNASRTNFFIVSDIELVPSEGLAWKFLSMVRRLMGDSKRNKGCVFYKTVFVVPLFEVERGEEIPRDKDTLVRLVAANRAKYFHQKSCSHCQRFPGLQRWLLQPSPTGVEPMVIAKRVYPYHRWEPLYFGTRKEPWYSEALSWEGKQDKMTQMLEICLRDYRLVVIDGGFLCHASTAPKSSLARNWRAVSANTKRYTAILHKLKRRYGDKSHCKIR